MYYSHSYWVRLNTIATLTKWKFMGWILTAHCYKMDFCQRFRNHNISQSSLPGFRSVPTWGGIPRRTARRRRRGWRGRGPRPRRSPPAGRRTRRSGSCIEREREREREGESELGIWGLSWIKTGLSIFLNWSHFRWNWRSTNGTI